MSRLHAALVTGLVTTISAASALANEKWGEAGHWEIFIDPAVGPGCYMETVMPDGTKVRLGALPEQGGGFIAALHRDWPKPEPGATGVARFDFGVDLFEGATEALSDGEWHGGQAFFNNPAFLENFERGNSVTIQSKGGLEFEFSLTGTFNATKAVLNCQNEQDAAVE